MISMYSFLNFFYLNCHDKQFLDDNQVFQVFSKLSSIKYKKLQRIPISDELAFALKNIEISSIESKTAHVLIKSIDAFV